MLSIYDPVLMFSPPVSNTTPLPTKIMGLSFTGFSGFHSNMVKVGGSILPLFTASRPPIFRASIFFLFRTSTLAPALFPISSISLASFTALSDATGSFTRSLHLYVASVKIFKSSISLLFIFEAMRPILSREFFFFFASL